MVSKGTASRGGTKEPGGEVIVYRTSDGDVRVDVRVERETVDSQR